MSCLVRLAFKYPFKQRLYSTAITVDAKEIEQFQKVTSEWWNQFGPMQGLHAMNRIRVPFIRDSLLNEGDVNKEFVASSTPLKNLSVFDIGCGGGILAEPLARLGACVTAIDANSSVIELAKRHAANSNLSINYLYSSIDEHAQNHCEKYDAVIASEVVEHITEKEKFIEACSRCLKPSGSMFITTINKTALANLFAVYLVQDIINLLPKNLHQYDKFIEPHRLQRILEDCGLRTKIIHGMFYNIFTNNWSWCSNTSINYAMHAVKN